MAKAISNTERQDAAGKQETLAVLEGHDADVFPTEDQTSKPKSYPNSLRSARSARSLKAAAAEHEPLPADAAQKQGTASKENNGKGYKSHDDEKKLSESGKETDLEAGRHSTSTADQKTPEVQSAEPVDPNVVDWDGPDDQGNPINWPEKKKWGNIVVLSSITFLTYVATAPSIALR